MGSKYETFDREKLRILPLDQRASDMNVSDVLEIDEASAGFQHPDLPVLTRAIISASQKGATVALMMGAHVIKQGLSRYVIDLIRRGWVSIVAVNGACAIHDYELARTGATTESVGRYISDGQFGLWTETGELNEIIASGDREELGFGEQLGKHIRSSDYPHKDISIFAECYECDVPVTVHVGVGYDIVHEHPNCDGGAVGRCSYRDFLIFARAMENLEGGVVLCFGSAVMGPEVFLKALAMARNVAKQEKREIRRFTTGVFDLVELPDDIHTEPGKDNPTYYYRPYKTLLVRTVADGGQGLYIRADHRATIPALHRLLCEGNAK